MTTKRVGPGCTTSTRDSDSARLSQAPELLPVAEYVSLPSGRFVWHVRPVTPNISHERSASRFALLAHVLPLGDQLHTSTARLGLTLRWPEDCPFR